MTTRAVEDNQAGQQKAVETEDKKKAPGTAVPMRPRIQAEDEEDIMPVLPVFGYRELNEPGKRLAAQVARIFSETLRALERTCPPGREFSLVRTKLEEACMFAKKSIAVDPRYQAGNYPDEATKGPALRHDYPPVFGGDPNS